MKNSVVLSLCRTLPFRLAHKMERYFDPIPLGTGYHQMQTRDGLNMEVSLRDMHSRKLFLFGGYEEHCVRWVRKLVRPGMCAIDGGANVGYYSLLLAKLVGRTGEVHAFEPQEAVIRILQRNIALNPGIARRIRVVPLGLGRTREKTYLFSTEKGSTGRASLARRFSNAETKEEIETIPLDTYLREQEIERVDFFKLDVEGFEMEALSGARSLFETAKKIAVLCEVHEREIVETGHRVEDLFCFFSDLGFCAFLPRAFPFRMRKIAATPHSFGSCSYIFLKGY